MTAIAIATARRARSMPRRSASGERELAVDFLLAEVLRGGRVEPGGRSSGCCGVASSRRRVADCVVAPAHLHGGVVGAVRIPLARRVLPPRLRARALPLLRPGGGTAAEEEPGVRLRHRAGPPPLLVLPPRALAQEELLPAVLEETGGHLGRRLLLVAWQAEEVDRGHCQELGICEEVCVVLHARRGDEQLPGAAVLEEGDRVRRRHKVILLPVDEERGARHVAYERYVREAFLQHVGDEPAHEGLGRLPDGREGSHEDEPANRKPARKVDRRPGAYRAAKQDDLLVRDFQVIEDEAEGRERHLL
mmetsp:Transcript_92679/g.262053  ORF Transcript_92679/g.262053 Transcript_92679/m.262053 type:complete len:305 (+) Transcript_92679:10-924(+)